jgi:hypothetical protein
MIRHSLRIRGKETVLAFVLGLLGLPFVVCGCVTSTSSDFLIRENSPSANLREAIVKAFKSCQTRQKIVVSGRLSGKSSINFEAISQSKPPEFSADFLSPLGNTVAIIETVYQQSSTESKQKTRIRCSGNCADSMGIPAALQALEASDYRNLICGSPAVDDLISSENAWARITADGAIQWTGKARFAGEGASAAVTVAEVGSCGEQATPSRLIKVTTELDFGWFFKDRFVTESRSCLTDNPEPQKLALDPATARIWSPSKVEPQLDLTIKFHAVESEP